MGSIAQLHDPEGDRLIRLAESLGEENLSEGERWRLANTRDARRRLEARAAQQGGRTDALDAQANERRFAALETHRDWASEMIRDVLPAVIGEVIGEAEQRAIVEAEKLLDQLRIQTNQKSDAQFAGFETAVSELRNEDRAALLTTVRETMSEAEARIDEHLAQALGTTWERAELEIAMVRDELLNIIAEKKYGVFTDDDPAKLAERAIAELRKRTAALEEENARMAGVADQLATLEAAYQKSRKSLLVRCATTAVTLRKETARADELAGKVAALETTLEQLVAALRENNTIG
jgi:hypothetical protein